MISKVIRTVRVLVLALLVRAPASAQAQPSSGGPPLRSSWTSDRVAVQEGDIVTILVDELTQASANTNETSSNDRNRNIRLGLSGSSAGLRATTAGLELVRQDYFAE